MCVGNERRSKFGVTECLPLLQQQQCWSAALEENKTRALHASESFTFPEPLPLQSFFLQHRAKMALATKALGLKAATSRRAVVVRASQTQYADELVQTAVSAPRPHIETLIAQSAQRRGQRGPRRGHGGWGESASVSSAVS